jgi:probable HAF family extracellular repeat protein
MRTTTFLMAGSVAAFLCSGCTDQDPTGPSASASPARALAGTYTAVDLGTLDGSDGASSAFDINAAGQIVGYSSLAGSEGGFRAVLWEHGVITNLGTLGGGSVATGINRAAQVVGWSSTAGASHAFLWEQGVMTDLGTLGGISSEATDINDAGQVVGTLTRADFGTDAFLWSNGVVTDLGTLGGFSSWATAINSAGQVVGYSNTAGGETHAFLWKDGLMTDLGTLGGSLSAATDINQAGQIVGYSFPAGEPPDPPQPRPINAFLWERGVMNDLGIGGNQARATGINSAGQVVGSIGDGDEHSDAFVWDRGVVTVLNTGGRLTSEAARINPKGQVVGVSTAAEGAQGHATLWTRQ